MVKVMHELQVIKVAYVEKIEAQRPNFQKELDIVKKKLVLSKVQIDILKDEINLLKGQLPVQGRRLAQIMLTANMSPIISISKSM